MTAVATLSVTRDDTPLVPDPGPLADRVADRAGTSTPARSMNGKMMGWGDGPALEMMLRRKKRAMQIYQDTCLVLDQASTPCIIDTDGARLVRPLLVVDPTTQMLEIEQKGLWNADIHTLLTTGCLEYVDIAETKGRLIASTYDRLVTRRDEESAARQEYETARVAQRDGWRCASRPPTRTGWRSRGRSRRRM